MATELGADREHPELRQVHSVTWFGPKRPVEGTIYVLPATSDVAVNDDDTGRAFDVNGQG
jgi:hypothetical protein